MIPSWPACWKETLVANGYDVCGTAGTVEKAVELGGPDPNLILLSWIFGSRMVAWGRNACPAEEPGPSGRSLCLRPCGADGPDE